MGIFKIDMERFVARQSGKAPYINITKKGQLVVLSALQEQLKLKKEDGIALAYDDDRGRLFLLLDNTSPIKFKAHVKKKSGTVYNTLFIQNLRLADSIRTYLKVVHDNAFRVKLENVNIGKGFENAYELKIAEK